MITIIYHAYQNKENYTDCPDGIIAAAILYKKLVQEGHEVMLYPDYYRPNEFYEASIPSWLINIAVECDSLYVVDFSYPREWAEQIQEICPIRIIDHHIDKLKTFDLANFSSAIYPPDESSDCGATLVWKFLYPEREVPEVLQRVRERDIGLAGYYRGLAPKSEAFNLALSDWRKDKRAKLSEEDYLLQLADLIEKESTVSDFLESAKEAIRKRDEILNPFLELAPIWILTYEGETFLVVDMPSEVAQYHSVFAQRALKKGQERYAQTFDFICARHPDGSLSIRTDSDYDTRTFARKLGGNGHLKASGVSKDAFGSKLIETLLLDKYPGEVEGRVDA